MELVLYEFPLLELSLPLRSILKHENKHNQKPRIKDNM